MLFDEIHNIEELNDLKLIEDVQYDYKIKQKDKNKSLSNKLNEDIPKELVFFNVELKKKDIKTDKKLLIQVRYYLNCRTKSEIYFGIKKF